MVDVKVRRVRSKRTAVLVCTRECHYYLSEPLYIQKVVTIRGLAICELGLVNHFRSLDVNEQMSMYRNFAFDTAYGL